MEAMYGGNMIIIKLIVHYQRPLQIVVSVTIKALETPEEHVMRLAGLLDHSMNTYYSPGGCRYDEVWTGTCR